MSTTSTTSTTATTSIQDQDKETEHSLDVKTSAQSGLDTRVTLNARGTKIVVPYSSVDKAFFFRTWFNALDDTERKDPELFLNISPEDMHMFLDFMVYSCHDLSDKQKQKLKLLCAYFGIDKNIGNATRSTITLRNTKVLWYDYVRMIKITLLQKIEIEGKKPSLLSTSVYNSRLLQYEMRSNNTPELSSGLNGDQYKLDEINKMINGQITMPTKFMDEIPNGDRLKIMNEILDIVRKFFGHTSV